MCLADYILGESFDKLGVFAFVHCS